MRAPRLTGDFDVLRVVREQQLNGPMLSRGVTEERADELGGTRVGDAPQLVGDVSFVADDADAAGPATPSRSSTVRQAGIWLVAANCSAIAERHHRRPR